MRARRTAALAMACAIGCAAGYSFVGCGARTDEQDEQQAGRSVTRLPQPGPELGKQLMVALALAQNYHHKADVYLKQARVDQAAMALRQILTIQFPPDAPEGVDVVQDARARLARVLVTLGKLDEALAVVDEGIAGARRDSFFLANLYTARGEVLEARAVVVEEKDEAAANAARRQAIEAFDRAIEMDKAVMEQLAGAGTGGNR
jgi:tetratricopeptide (TPR) repeat protein